MGGSVPRAWWEEMKLLFAIKKLNDLPGGAERVLCMVASELNRRGHDVSVLSFDHVGGTPYYHLSPRITRIELGVGDPGRRARISETLKRIVALRRQIIHQRPDVVIGFGHSIFVILAMALIGLRVPLIGSEHIAQAHYRTRPLQALLYALTAPLMREITVVSQEVKAGFPRSIREKMVTIPNPVSTWEPETKTRMAKRRGRLVLNVGRFHSQKDQRTLIQAFAMLPPEFEEWRLRLVGDGELRHDLQDEVRRLNLGSRVEFPGTTKNIQQEYVNADIFVLSSIYESFGLVVVEAMQCELPTIGFADCPGVNELIIPDENGILVQPGSNRPAALASALTQLMRDEDQRIRLGKAGCASVAHKFALGTVVDMWERTIERVATAEMCEE